MRPGYRYPYFPFFALLLAIPVAGLSQDARNVNYISNREPLAINPYIQLPLGSIKAKGWLLEQLRLSADGMTGHLDEIWTDVGPENGWLGGKGDSWERGPYWVDGLLPLAYTLNDPPLIAKAKRWVEWSLTHQRADGYFGPVPDTTRTFSPQERVLAWQERNKEDWWPHMVMLKVLEQYYDATSDRRVLDLMTKYFRYQLRMLASRPLGYWTDWAKARGGENLASIYWLYNRTGDPFLLELAPLVFRQTYDWTGMMESGDPKYWHGVNTGMGVKQPGVYYQQSRDERYLRAAKKGILDLMKYHGQIEGLFSGDELLHGMNPVQGTEFCTVVEYMFSLETLVKITGDLDYADMLERVAFNALPAQSKPDFTGRQYYQMPNQILCDSTSHQFNTRHWGTVLFGLDNGYGCCTANYHQGWPKLTAHLWLATQDNGLAAMVYAPSEVVAKIAKGVEVKFSEETSYPFDGTITLRFESRQPVDFPLHLRIPSWCRQPSISVNGMAVESPKPASMARILRTWKTGDVVVLRMPMPVRLSNWYEESVGVERGPLVFALGLHENWTKVRERGRYSTYSVSTNDAWNYGLVISNPDFPDSSFSVNERQITGQPWSFDTAPVSISAVGRRIASWQQYGSMTGPIPWSPVRSRDPDERLTLIPYGCARLRISEFPVIE